jgi:RimJ/RimL family protein N-acetyltransferase
MPSIPQPLIGRRVVLRELVTSDWEGIHSYARLPEACRYQTWGPNTEDQTRSFCAQQIAAASEEPRTLYAVAITTTSDDAIKGVAALNVRSFDYGQGEISYILHPDIWGQGYATEAALLLLQFGFSELQMHRIYATCDPRNVASTRVLEKLGMTYEGHMRETMHIRDGWRDSLLYSILRREWSQTSTLRP